MVSIMTEPWERVKMALCEAGRPDMAAEIMPPGPDFGYAVHRAWRRSLSEADEKVLYQASRLASLEVDPRVCFSCWADWSDRQVDDGSRCPHV